MSFWVFLIFRQRSSCYPIVSVGFCKACLFFKNVLCLQLHYFFHFPTICVLRTWNHQCFVLNLVITDSLTIHSPLFFLLLSSITPCLSLHVSLSLFMYIRTVDNLLLPLKQKTGREENKAWLLPSKGSECVWTSSIGSIKSGSGFKGWGQRRGSGMNAIVIWV